MPNFSHETRAGRRDGKVICGVDEVGRGPLAGPVIAVAAIVPARLPKSLQSDIRDSKKMTAKAREALYPHLTALCAYAIAAASVAEIDRINILWASMLAMERAVNQLHGKCPVDTALIDGNRAPSLSCNTQAIIGGDDKSLSIAVASIIAKVHRDRLMTELAEEFPYYGWERNAGYGTSEHLRALEKFGTTPWHRTTFAPVRAASFLSAG